MARMTKLEAINEMLAAIEEDPVSSLSTGSPDALIAEQLLDKQTRQLQERGWWFNTERGFPLKTDSNGEIPLPNNCIRVDEDRYWYSENGQLVYELPEVTQRGGRLYNRDTFSYVFEGNTTLRAVLVVELPFEVLPEVAKEYITSRAGRIFQDRTYGEAQKHSNQFVDEKEAFARLRQAELEANGANFFNNVEMIDNTRRDVTAPRWLQGGGRGYWRI